MQIYARFLQLIDKGIPCVVKFGKVRTVVRNQRKIFVGILFFDEDLNQ